MAVYCPVYDPAYGWYIIICGPHGSYKKTILSPLYYYHTMGVKPPVGAQFTPEDYMNFDLDLGDSQFLGASALSPLSSLPPISSLTAPISTNSSQATAAPVSQYDNLSDLKDPHLISTFGLPSAYSSAHKPSTLFPASSPHFSPAETSAAKNLFSLHKKLNAVESILSTSFFGGKSGSLSLPTSPFTSSSAYPSATNGAGFNSNSPLKHPSTLSYLFPLPLTPSSLPHHLHSLPSTSSGNVKVLPSIKPQYPVHGAASANSSNVNNYPMSTADYDDSMKYAMHLDDVDETPMEADDCDF